MNPTARTSIFVAAAAVLLVITAVAVPQRQKHAQFSEEGEPLFAPFDPLDVISMEVTEYDEERGVVKPFKVAFQDGGWVIPSHENYPADAKDQLADTAALLVGLVKGDFRSDREADYKTFGVIDPRDVTSAGFTGRGKRVTLNDKTGRTVADLIIGREVGGDSRYGYYYVRQPDSKRVYTCKVDAGGISTRFADWVETDLLQLASDDIVQVELDRHKVDEVSGWVIPGELATLRLKDDKWELVGDVPKGSKNANANANANENENENELDTDKLNTLKDSLSSLTLVGVRRKPPGILDIVRRAEEGYRLSRQERDVLQYMLQPLGYFIGQNPSTGEVLIVSNEGEIRVKSKDGVVYKLRFGEVVYGEPDEISAAQKKKLEKAAEAKGEAVVELPEQETEKTEKDDDGGREHRYLWVVTAFDESLLGPKPQPPVKTDKPQQEQPEKEKEEDPKDGKDEDEDKGQDLDDYDQQQEDYEEKLEEYEKKLEDGKKRAEQLKQRFAEWYYVISADAYKNVNLSHENIFKKKEVEAEEDESITDDEE